MKGKYLNPKKKFYIGVSIITFGFLATMGIVLNTLKNPNNSLVTKIEKGIQDGRFSFTSSGDAMLSSSNLTDNVIQKYGFQIAFQNPSGPQGEKISLPSASILETAFAEELKKSIEFSLVMESDIRVVNDDSHAQEEYLKNIRRIAEKNTKEVGDKFSKGLNDLTQKGDGDGIENVAQKFDALVADLLDTNVPSSWKKFHLDLVNLEKRKAATLHALAAIDDDPVKSVVALRELQNIGKDEGELSKIFSQKVASKY